MASSLETPRLVLRAAELARRRGLERSCDHELGRLLHVLAAQRGRTRVGEVGTGSGLGAAWIVSALAPSVPFVSVEVDAEHAAAAHALFAADERVHVLEGDWRDLLPHEAPFDLLVCRGPCDADAVAGLLAPGGTVVATGGALAHPTLVAVEVAVSAGVRVTLGARAL